VVVVSRLFLWTYYGFWKSGTPLEPVDGGGCALSRRGSGRGATACLLLAAGWLARRRSRRLA